MTPTLSTKTNNTDLTNLITDAIQDGKKTVAQHLADLSRKEKE